MNNKKISYLIIFVTILIIECLIATFFKHGFIREYIGDILVIPCIYTMLKIIFSKTRGMAFYVLIFAIIIEFMQLLNITTLISKNNKTLSIALGGTFDIKDIICYVIGYIIIILIENKRRCN